MRSSTSPHLVVLRCPSPSQASSPPSSCQAPSRTTRWRCGFSRRSDEGPLHHGDRAGLRAEAQEAGRRFGIAEYKVLDNHDGELEPTLAVRQQVIRRIRSWQADVVIAPRPNDCHPDHRYAGVVVQDSAYMVVVPNVAPDTQPLRRDPVFLHSYDYFQRPNPFRPDVAVAIDAVIERKIKGLDAHESQMYEWLPWVDGTLDAVPREPAARLAWLRQTRSGQPIRDDVRSAQEDGAKAEGVKDAEAFEVCEYGRRPSEADLRRLFPFFD